MEEYGARLAEIAERRADRHCRRCGIELSQENWDKHDRINNSRICRRCGNDYSKEWLAENPKKRKSYTLKTYFGITLDEARVMWERQGRNCWLCQCDLSFKEVNVDHNHKSGEVRGLVHNICNAIAGLAHDSPELLDRISESLWRYELACEWTIASEG